MCRELEILEILEKLEDLCVELGIEYYRLDGSVPEQIRWNEIKGLLYFNIIPEMPALKIYIYACIYKKCRNMLNIKMH